MSGLWLVTFLVQWVIVLVLLVLVAGILRYLASVEERWNLIAPPVSSYELGQRIENFALPDMTGQLIHSEDLLRRSNGAVFLFVSTSCSACEALLAQVSEIATRPNGLLKKSLVVVVLGVTGNLEQLLVSYPSLSNEKIVVLTDPDGIALRQFGITAVPLGLALDRESRLVHQTHNPHVTKWLYVRLDVTPPTEPISSGRTSLIVPAAYRSH